MDKTFTPGLNSLCYVVIDNKITRHVRVEHLDPLGMFYECRDTTTNELYSYQKHSLMPATKTPARYKRNLFDGVAFVIGAALNAYPDYIIVDPQDLSVDTYARRIREAITAKQLFGYPHTLIDETKFKLTADELQVHIMKSGKIHVGPQAALKQANPAKNQARVTFPTKTTETRVTSNDPENIERLCRLLHDRVFDPSPSFVVEGLTEPQTADLEARYDIAFVPFENEPNKWMIVV